MYVLFLKRRIILRVSNFIDKKSPIKNYAVTEHDIDEAGDALDKMFKMIESSVYFEQLETAEKYLDVYFQRFPFAILIEKMVRRKIEKEKKNVEFYDLDFYSEFNSIEIKRLDEVEQDFRKLETKELFDMILSLTAKTLPFEIVDKARKEYLKIAKKVFSERMNDKGITWNTKQ